MKGSLQNRAFSLIEVLIAVLVLALGLLGLGAVFPAVIAEQRRSFDSITGEGVAQVAADMLSRGDELVDLSDVLGPSFGVVGPPPPENNGNTNVGNPGAIGAAPAYDYQWVMDDFAAIDGAPGYNWSVRPGAASFGDLQAGIWRARVDRNLPAEILPVASRLHPLPTSGADPRFVWDFVARRTPAGPIEIAVFVRRIDDRIRVSSGDTLSDTMTGANGAPRQLPLAVNIADGRLVAPVPGATNQAYPVPQSLGVYVHRDQLSWLIFEASPEDSNLDTSIGFVRRVGQKFVDNTGVVRTVVGLPQPRPGERLAGLASRAVVVSPPFNASEASDGTRLPPPGSAGGSATDRNNRTKWVRQIVFTPQTPIAVRVFTLNKE